MGVYNTTACLVRRGTLQMNVIQMVLKGDSHQLLVVIILNPKDFR